MAALDFTEISAAHKGNARDSFELFAREALEAFGFDIIQSPDRGADDGCDLIVEEIRTGVGGKNTVRWLVSCKHKAHSDKSVTPTDEAHLRDRIETHGCHGFIAFYSTVPSSGLSANLNTLKPNFEYLQLDRDAIEKRLLSTPQGRAVAARYMPKSIQIWSRATQATAAAEKIAPDPQISLHHFFLREPHNNFISARNESESRNVPIFAVIYDPDHPTHSKLEHALGYFMEYRTTKKLVDEHFVAAVIPRDADDAGKLVPDDNPLERCLWVVLDPKGNIIDRQGVSGNPDSGMNIIRMLIKRFEQN